MEAGIAGQVVAQAEEAGDLGWVYSQPSLSLPTPQG